MDDFIKRVENPELEYTKYKFCGSFYIGYREECKFPGVTYHAFKIGYTNRPLSVRLNEYRGKDQIWKLIYSIKSDIIGAAEYIENRVLNNCYSENIERRTDYMGEKTIGREWFSVSDKSDFDGEDLKKKLIEFAENCLKDINKMTNREKWEWKQRISRRWNKN